VTKPGVTGPAKILESAPENLSGIERALGAALREFASELRLADAADFAAFIRIGHMPNLQSLVQSSAELYFKPGTLELAEPGELDLDWSQPPLITLPMKFRHAGVRVYFRLRLAAVSAAVEVESITAENGATGEDLLRCLQEALAGARLAQS
jgi:hypothetical protein